MRQLYLGILLCSVFSLPNLIVHEYPERHSGWYAVELPVPGMEASDLFSDVSKMVGQSLLNIDGVERVFCEAGDGTALWLVQYPAGTDQVFIHSEITGVLHQCGDALPYQSGTPRLSQLPDEHPVLFAYLSFNLDDVNTLRLDCRELEERILQLPGIREVEFLGVPRREIEVLMRPLSLEALRLHPMRLVHLIEGFLFQFSLGVWSSAARRTDIQASASIDSLEGLADLPVALEESFPASYCPLSEIAGVQWARPLYARRVLQNTREGVLLRISYDSRSPLYRQILCRYSISRLLETLPEEKNEISACRIISAPSHRFSVPLALLCSVFLIGLLLTFPERSPFYSAAAAGCNLTLRSIGRAPLTPITVAGLASGMLLVSLLPSMGKDRAEGQFRNRILTGILIIFFTPVLLLSVISIQGSSGVPAVLLRDMLTYPFSWLREAGTTLMFGIVIEGLSDRLDGGLPYRALPADRNEVRDTEARIIIPLYAAAGVALSVFFLNLNAGGSPVTVYAVVPPEAPIGLEGGRPLPEDTVSLDYPGGPPDISRMPLQSLLCRIYPQTRYNYGEAPAAAAYPDTGTGYITLPLQYNPDELHVFLEEVLIPLQHYALKNDYRVTMKRETAGTFRLSRRELFEQLSFISEGVPVGTLHHGADGEYYPVRVRYDIPGGISVLPALPVFSSDGSSQPLEEYALLTCRKKRTAYCCIMP